MAALEFLTTFINFERDVSRGMERKVVSLYSNAGIIRFPYAN